MQIFNPLSKQKSLRCKGLHESEACGYGCFITYPREVRFNAQTEKFLNGSLPLTEGIKAAIRSAISEGFVQLASKLIRIDSLGNAG